MSSDNGKELAGKVAIVTGAGRFRRIGPPTWARLGAAGAGLARQGSAAA